MFERAEPADSLVQEVPARAYCHRKEETMPQIHSGSSFRRERRWVATGHRSTYEQAWNGMFDRLLQYKSIYGNCLVPRSYKEDLKLGRWVNKQRTRKEKLSVERKERLEKAGFVWCLQKHEEWSIMRERRREYSIYSAST